MLNSFPQILNPFPDLLTYSLLAPFILRVVVGFIFIDLGKLSLQSERKNWIISFKTLGLPGPEISVKIFGGLQLGAGVMLLIGFYTQIAALILALLVLIEGYIEYKDPSIIKRNLVFYVLLFAILLSLLLSGAGAFAIDLPL
jgi:uncharacterized membrane protein YphA (DoxX/SURF4 family)